MDGESDIYLNYMLDNSDDLIRKKNELISFIEYWENRIKGIKNSINKANRDIKIINEILEIRNNDSGGEQ
jgi:uncharacterized protein Usg